MIRKISFNVSQRNHDNILLQILNGIEESKYYWNYISNQSEVWKNLDGGLVFEQERYNNHDFFKCLSSEHFVISIKLQAYKNDDDFSEIHSREDFYDSKCFLLILINDCEFVEIYTKEDSIANCIYKNAMSAHFKKISCISEDFDSRISFDIM